MDDDVKEKRSDTWKLVIDGLLNVLGGLLMIAGCAVQLLLLIGMFGLIYMGWLIAVGLVKGCMGN